MYVICTLLEQLMKDNSTLDIIHHIVLAAAS